MAGIEGKRGKLDCFSGQLSFILFCYIGLLVQYPFVGYCHSIPLSNAVLASSSFCFSSLITYDCSSVFDSCSVRVATSLSLFLNLNVVVGCMRLRGGIFTSI